MLAVSDIRDGAVLLALSTVLGLASVAARSDSLPWVADAPDPTAETCASDGVIAAQVQRISVGEAVDLLGREDVTFVDARSGAAYRTGHIPGAITLPAADAAGVLEVQSVPIAPENLVITYCDGGLACQQSEYLGLLLRDRIGCDQVMVLEGGWASWVAADSPIMTESGSHG